MICCGCGVGVGVRWIGVSSVSLVCFGCWKWLCGCCGWWVVVWLCFMMYRVWVGVLIWLVVFIMFFMIGLRVFVLLMMW